MTGPLPERQAKRFLALHRRLSRVFPAWTMGWFEAQAIADEIRQGGHADLDLSVSFARMEQLLDTVEAARDEGRLLNADLLDLDREERP